MSIFADALSEDRGEPLPLRADATFDDPRHEEALEQARRAVNCACVVARNCGAP